MDFSNIKRIIKVQGLTLTATVYLHTGVSTVLKYFKGFDCIYETHVVSGIAYGDISLVKLCDTRSGP